MLTVKNTKWIIWKNLVVQYRFYKFFIFRSWIQCNLCSRHFSRSFYNFFNSNFFYNKRSFSLHCENTKWKVRGRNVFYNTVNFGLNSHDMFPIRACTLYIALFNKVYFYCKKVQNGKFMGKFVAYSTASKNFLISWLYLNYYYTAKYRSDS